MEGKTTVVYFEALIAILLAFILVLPSHVMADMQLESDQFQARINADGSSHIISKNPNLEVVVDLSEIENNLLEVSVSITNRSQVRQTIGGALLLKVGLELEAITDHTGGFGSNLHTYVNPFLSSKRETSVITALNYSEYSVNDQDWFGWVNLYEIDAIRLNQFSDWSLYIPENIIEISAEKLYLIQPQPPILAPGETHNISIHYLSSPRLKNILDLPEIQLEATILMNLWDWFRAVCFVLRDFLDLLFKISNNWAISIVLLALFIKLITFPITKKSLGYQHKARLQNKVISPKVKKLKQEFSGVEFSENLIQLYENEKYDNLAPLKGMLGLLIQIPIFIALFNVISEMSEFRGASFLWISDLSASDRLFSWGVNIPFFGEYFNFLPVIMTVIAVLSTIQASRSSVHQATTAISLFGMSGLFFLIFYSFPAALVLYWLSSSLFQWIQQSIEFKLKP